MGKKKGDQAVEQFDNEDPNANEDMGKYGKPMQFDPNFKGPIENRSCTDIICCILFLIVFVGYLAVCFYAFAMGNPKYLLYPEDTDKNLCGLSASVSDKPYLYFFDLTVCAQVKNYIGTGGCPTPQVCMKTCPDYYWVWPVEYAKEEALGGVGINVTSRQQMICRYDVDPVTSHKQLTIKQLVDRELCAPYVIKSTAVVGRCVPDIFREIIEGVSGAVNINNETLANAQNATLTIEDMKNGAAFVKLIIEAKQFSEKVFADLRTSWWLILVCLLIAAIVAFIWIVLMRFIAGFMVWFTILIFVLLFAFATVFCFIKWDTVRKSDDHNTDVIFTTNIDYYAKLDKTWLAFGILAAVILLILLIVIIFLRNRIRIAVEIIKETSRAISSMMSVLFFPIVPFVLLLVMVALWAAAALFLASVGRAETAGHNSSLSSIFTCDGREIQIGQNVSDTFGINVNTSEICSFINNSVRTYVTWIQVFLVFMLFWTVNFVTAFSQISLAGAFASYYWAFRKPDDVPHLPVLGGLWRAFRYHIGTAAFGSLIIAIVQLIRLALNYLDRKLKKSELSCARFLVKCCKCCMWCLEKFLRFLNKNAYVITATYGKNFCSAAKEAFFLILRNVVRVAVVDKVTDFVIFIAKLVVVGGTAALSWAFVTQRVDLSSTGTNLKINYWLVPVLVVILGSYIIASVFFSVYSMGVSTIFLSFLMDVEKNDGSPDKPYFMTVGLQKVLDKKNKFQTPKS